MTRIDSEGRDITGLPGLYDDENEFACPECGEMLCVDECDSVGACPGNVICPQCDTEIDEDGNAAEPCGKCSWCLAVSFCFPPGTSGGDA